MNYVVNIQGLMFIVTTKEICNYSQSEIASITPDESKLLNFYLQRELDYKGEIKAHTDAQISEKIALPEKNIKQHRAKLVKCFRTVESMPKDDYPTSLFFSSDIRGKTYFNHQVFPTNYTTFGTEKKQVAQQKIEAEEKANDKVYHIINALTEAYPHQKTAIFQTDANHFLPFTALDKTCSLPFNFPLNVDSEQSAFTPIEGIDSLFKTRKESGKTLYPGKILQLKNTTEGYRLGMTSYYDVLDSCDIVGATLKRNWTILTEQGIENREKLQEIKNKTTEIGNIANLWNERLSQVKNGDFSHYLAGLAFSLPMFQIHESGDLSLVFAEGSILKASGFGAKHVVPAGMQEVFSDINPTTFSIEDFRALASKELFEETLFGSKFKLKSDSAFKSYIELFSTELAGKLPATYRTINANVLDVLDLWDDLWKNFEGWNRDTPPSKEAIEQVQQFNTDTPPWFFIIDILSFRPEIIKPIYLHEDLDCFLNWEYKDNHNAPEIVTWRNQDELEDWIERHRKDFCGPGIASAYLGARYYFQNKEKMQRYGE